MKTLKSFFKLMLNSAKAFGEDQCTVWAAAIAYYTLLSVFPLILGVVAVAGLIISDPKTQQDITKSLTSNLSNLKDSGVDIESIIKEFISSLKEAAPFLLAFSLLTTLWSGSGIFEQIINAINVTWKIKDKRNFFVKGGLRFLMLIFLGLLFLTSFAITIFIEIVKSTDVQVLGFSSKNLNFLADVLVFLLPYTITIFIFVIIFWLSPDRKAPPKPRKMRWQPVLLAGVLTAFLFEVAKFGLTFYITNFASTGYARTYGALAGVIIFLFFVYVIACIILFGSEIAHEADNMVATRVLAEKEAQQKAAELAQAEVQQQKEVLATTAANANTKNSPLVLVVGLITLGIAGAVGALRSRRS